jgi:small subunit ribosomal protein S4
MGKNLEPQCKQCRRAGEKLFLKGERCKSPKCAVIKRNYAPGFHGPKQRRRLTDYGQQLNEKQKAKKQYNLLENQFRLTFVRASNQPGNVGENFIKMLEMRLDNIIYRLGFADSRYQARQMVSHGMFEVNGIKTNIPSFQAKTGDLIAVRANKKNAKLFTNLGEKLKGREVPGWLNLDTKALSGKVLHQPDMKSMVTNFNIQMIVEFYSR